jgi:uncharacterized protein YukE
MRSSARQLERAAADLDSLVQNQRITVFELTTTGGWTGSAANAFEDRAVEPVCQALSGIARELERVADALRRGANTVEEAQFERRRAEELAIAAGVGVALTLLTFAISDVLAADAAAGASALMVRAAAAGASASRAVGAVLQEAEAAIGVLSTRLATMGQTMVLGISAGLPRLMESPAFAGIAAAVDTAAVGDTSPEDLLQALAMGYLEGKTGGVAETDGASRPVVLEHLGRGSIYKVRRASTARMSSEIMWGRLTSSWLIAVSGALRHSRTLRRRTGRYRPRWMRTRPESQSG